MLATAISLAEATKQAIYDEEIMGLAGELHTRRNELNDNQFPRYIYMYSVALASKVADLTTKVLLTKEELSDLFDKEKKDKIKSYEKSLANLLKDKFKYFQLNLNNIFSRLNSLDTNKILKRGFSIIRDINNNVIYKKNHAHKNGDIIIELSDGKIKAKIN